MHLREEADVRVKPKRIAYIAVTLLSLLSALFALGGVVLFGTSGLVIIDGWFVEGQSYDPGEASISFAIAATLELLCLAMLVLIYSVCFDSSTPRKTRVGVTLGIALAVAALVVTASVVLLQGRPTSVSSYSPQPTPLRSHPRLSNPGILDHLQIRDSRVVGVVGETGQALLTQDLPDLLGSMAAGPHLIDEAADQ